MGDFILTLYVAPVIIIMNPQDRSTKLQSLVLEGGSGQVLLLNCVFFSTGNLWFMLTFCVFLLFVCRYVVTFSPLMDTKDDPQAIIIWDVLTGQKKRGFHCESSAHWPIFKWVIMPKVERRELWFWLIDWWINWLIWFLCPLSVNTF